MVGSSLLLFRGEAVCFCKIVRLLLFPAVERGERRKTRLVDCLLYASLRRHSRDIRPWEIPFIAHRHIHDVSPEYLGALAGVVLQHAMNDSQGQSFDRSIEKPFADFFGQTRVPVDDSCHHQLPILAPGLGYSSDGPEVVLVAIVDGSAGGRLSLFENLALREHETHRTIWFTFRVTTPYKSDDHRGFFLLLLLIRMEGLWQLITCGTLIERETVCGVVWWYL